MRPSRIRCFRRFATVLAACCLLATCALLGTATAALGPARASTIAPSVAEWLAASGPGDRVVVWVFLEDKGKASPAQVEDQIAGVARAFDPKAIERRLAARPQSPFSEADLPIFKPYIDAIKLEGVEIRSFSRWLNALSVTADAGQIERLASEPFVKELRRVSGRKGGPEPETWPSGLEGAQGAQGLSALYDYGPSWRQLAQIQATDLHSEGYTGAGIRIAILDTGFWLGHEAFAGLNKIAEHDFINDDGVTANEAGDPAGQHDHGTMCLSLLAGNSPGHIMGAAFDAEYILAKTEDTADEQPVEEDWWIEAAEWADSLGAQIISTSLGYTDWYTYADMDGDTAPITIAADMAAANGIVVVAAAGNQGAISWRYIGAPADGDSVISAGSVDSTGVRSYFSSQGPTYDGRIKPTVMAMGQADYIADPRGVSMYRRGNGTSFSTPLVAGSIALIIQKNPYWTPGTVIEAITMTGTQASNPDTLSGWGILQAQDASDLATSGVGPVAIAIPSLRVFPNPCRDSFSLLLSGSSHASRVPLRIFDVRGRLLCEVPVAGDSAHVVLQSGLNVGPGFVFIDVPGSGRAKVLVLK